jgi:hypothetical protein
MPIGGIDLHARQGTGDAARDGAPAGRGYKRFDRAFAAVGHGAGVDGDRAIDLADAGGHRFADVAGGEAAFELVWGEDDSHARRTG